jgi:hypothetical protein
MRRGLQRYGGRLGKAVWPMSELVLLALEVARLLIAGEAEKAERKAKALAQGIALKKGARELAKR